MQTFVLDACVGTKWFFEEEMSERANCFLEAARREKILLVVPELFYLEIASACFKRVRHGLVSAGDALEAFDRLYAFPIERRSDWEFSDVALENALRLGISVYDGIYLALAEAYVTPLITVDETLLRACRGKFDFIESLAEVEI